MVSRTEIQKVPPTPENPKGEQEVVIEKNTNEKAVVRILVPKRTMTLSEVNAEENKREEEGKEVVSEKKEGEEAPDGDQTAQKTATEPDAAAEDSKLQEGALNTDPASRSQQASRLSRVPEDERIVEQDQEDRALTIGNRINLATPYMVSVMNQYAAKAHRTDFVDQLRSKLVDFFSERENAKMLKQIQEMADDEAEAVDAAYIAQTCDEYELPCLDYPVHAPDHE